MLLTRAGIKLLFVEFGEALPRILKRWIWGFCQNHSDERTQHSTVECLTGMLDGQPQMERRMKIDDVGPNFEHGSTLISYREPVEMQIWWLACLAIRNSETLLNPANP